ncbi:hypothetical protein [Streptomyces oceani]|uniref:DUF3040 domain-containing protein n=1 Tax=Streptomyces oceani TaxID=1075402 RepID=A0A1E7KII1_9ACTN|nr:hypothetical protein [Streptomyces oceani]OEV03686.1 hypothetical protein AN216_10565 [Streptomyces oceani]
MSRDRREEEVRRMLDAGLGPLPADLADRAVERGGRRLRRQRQLRMVCWTLVLAAAVSFAVWAALVEPWQVPPTETTPDIYGW